VADQPTAVIDTFTCTICLKVKKDAVTLVCSHSFCLECINRWSLQHPHCPLCRAVFQPYCNLQPVEIKEVHVVCRYNSAWKGSTADEVKHYETCIHSPSALKPQPYDPNICPLCDNPSNQVCLTCTAGLTEHDNCGWQQLQACNHRYHYRMSVTLETHSHPMQSLRHANLINDFWSAGVLKLRKTKKKNRHTPAINK